MDFHEKTSFSAVAFCVVLCFDFVLFFVFVLLAVSLDSTFARSMHSHLFSTTATSFLWIPSARIGSRFHKLLESLHWHPRVTRRVAKKLQGSPWEPNFHSFGVDFGLNFQVVSLVHLILLERQFTITITMVKLANRGAGGMRRQPLKFGCLGFFLESSFGILK